MTNEKRVTSTLLNEIIVPLGELGVVSDTIGAGMNSWQGWVRVPKKGETWESENKRLNGIQRLDGYFHRVNITYVSSFKPSPGCNRLPRLLSSRRYIPKQSRGSALLALTGDEDYVLDCTRKAVQAGLYLNEWGLWEWEPDSQSLSRFKTSDAPHAKTSLGAIWGSETEADKGRWVQLETTEEEQVLNAIGVDYVPPNKRNFRFLTGKVKPVQKGRVFLDL